MPGLTFRIDENYSGPTLSGLVENFTRKHPKQFIRIDAILTILSQELVLPVPEEVYSQLYAPTDPDAPQPIRSFRPVEEIRGREATWREVLKRDVAGLAERL